MLIHRYCVLFYIYVVYYKIYKDKYIHIHYTCKLINLKIDHILIYHIYILINL